MAELGHLSVKCRSFSRIKKKPAGADPLIVIQVNFSLATQDIHSDNNTGHKTVILLTFLVCFLVLLEKMQ